MIGGLPVEIFVLSLHLSLLLADKQIMTLSSCQNLVSDDYKPDGEDTDESCSSGVDENELEDETQSEEDIEDISEKVFIYVNDIMERETSSLYELQYRSKVSCHPLVSLLARRDSRLKRRDSRL